MKGERIAVRVMKLLLPLRYPSPMRAMVPLSAWSLLNGFITPLPSEFSEYQAPVLSRA